MFGFKSKRVKELEARLVVAETRLAQASLCVPSPGPTHPAFLAFCEDYSINSDLVSQDGNHAPYELFEDKATEDAYAIYVRAWQDCHKQLEIAIDAIPTAYEYDPFEEEEPRTEAVDYISTLTYAQVPADFMESILNCYPPRDQGWNGSDEWFDDDVSDSVGVI